MVPKGVLDCIPSEKWCLDALEAARANLPEAIFNHSLRVYLIARWLAKREPNHDLDGPDSLPLVFAAAIFHDIGACELYNGKQRFEVEGADAAAAHLEANGVSKSDSHRVWTAIALHTSPGIAERIDPLTRLIRVAVKIDFSSEQRALYKAEDLSWEIEQHLPRLDIERVLAKAVVDQAEKIPKSIDRTTWLDSDKHPSSSWPGILLRAHIENPDCDGVNPAF
ncbi:hypothetical protein NLU13_0473 [Sarocladium strictum]|uniref:HD/PDEase domain-containing protein n=1 Tax=Sarocladium strictum TaxID=5046 RepID=A0AA39GPV9_SARSR|nr:hypothetical protein NLU13_0473 [Sarocladium strictum]